MPEVFISFAELRSVHGIKYCRLHLNRLVKGGLFPSPVWLSPNRKAWRGSDVEAWKGSLGRNRPMWVAAPADRENADAAA